jgi:DNA-binding PadR family transcriptional regulator
LLQDDPRLKALRGGQHLSEELWETVGRSVSRGSVYVTLDRSEGKGWIESELSESRLAS